MKRTTFGKAALASLLVATTMVGCTGAAFRTTATAVHPTGDAAKFATAAEKALAGRNGAQAIASAEAAVRLAPDNATYRQLLGRAYVQLGRFASAETALSDAVTLGSSDARTIVSLALVQVAQGRADAARSLLTAHADTVPASDYGLAMAMAGDTAEGVRILSEAIQDPSANVRTRQNLAYAYALAGRWKDARMVVGMDMDSLAANKRITDWAQVAEPSLAPQRVAALMGVAIDGADAGLPVALALAPTGAAVPVEMAAAAPEPVEALQPEAPVEVAIVEPAPVAPTVQPARVAFVREHRAAPAPVKVAKARLAPASAPVAQMRPAAFIKPVGVGASNWVVQLGAFESAAVAKDKWMKMAGRNGAIAAFPVLTSEATIKGRVYHRLAISGFAKRADAMTACHAIKAKSGQCFVRESAPGATPQRWAIATRGRQFASR
ncbi:tetratricopeptide repeat protein [Sphingobium sp.]|uniref:SPOR domain-containing protein n=1 Tax=Sphingobium sp. TaxID=1912891 RepID=UPI003BB656E5